MTKTDYQLFEYKKLTFCIQKILSINVLKLLMNCFKVILKQVEFAKYYQKKQDYGENIPTAWNNFLYFNSANNLYTAHTFIP